ncbi:hypothetical protein CALVIDRAFT_566644 [Calocera viscosa TUFC12733]|uniref:Dynamitin-domain-containing protein n=1 Tax=Calocera viscosa (strain TUFC12733) TaxID=1330018 RepID=A0A167JB29_CALVF|nr:hypothetical protein CALVIDRAFT_566644 [Calocera viscosa TUFC12733]
MSQKYAGLPDIDALQDVYETLSPPESPILKDEDDLDEAHIRALRLQREQEKEAEREARRAGGRLGGDQGRKVPIEELEEIEWQPGVSVEQGKKRWRKREREAIRKADIIATFELEETPLQRFARLQQELADLEEHVSKRSLSKGKARLENGDSEGLAEGGMMHSLLELRERLGKLEGGGELQEEEEEHIDIDEQGEATKTNGDAHPAEGHDRRASTSSEKGSVDFVALDRRLFQIESLLGSNTISSSEPHPPPLVPTITRLSSQISLLTQPRHMDGLSRRLKTLLSDLERYDQHVHPSQQAPAANPGWPTGRSRQPTGPAQEEKPAQQNTQQLMQFLGRLDPLLPTLPPLLLRLRSLSALHASAATFGSRLKEAEEREKAMEAGLEELEAAVDGLEKGMGENRDRVERNVSVLEERVQGLVGRLEALEGAPEQ